MDNGTIRKPVNGFGIASVIFGIVGILTICACGIGFFFGLIGVILGILGLTVQKNAGRGLPITGLIISGIALVFGCFWMVMYISAKFTDTPSYNASVTPPAQEETTTEAETAPLPPGIEQSGTYALETGTQYSFMNEDHEVYIANAISDSILRIEYWKRPLLNPQSTKHQSDVGTYKINDEENGFAWVDEDHTAFLLTFADKSNSSMRKAEPHVFTINISDDDTNKGSVYSKNIACYSYTTDDTHKYRAIPLTDSLIRVECWTRLTTLGSYAPGWDLMLIDLNDPDTDFEWTDDAHKGFTITAKDSKNTSYWTAEQLVAFTLENEQYSYSTVKSYLNSHSSSEPEEREQKNGYADKTNKQVNIGKFSFSVPDYWKADTNKANRYKAYAETDGKVAFLDIRSAEDTEDPVNFDTLKKDTENGAMAEAMKQSFETCEVTSTEEYDNGNIKGYLYYADFKQGSIVGKETMLCFPSESDNQWIYVTLAVSDNTEYRYDDDFKKILDSIAPRSGDSGTDPTDENDPLAGVKKVGINEEFGNKTITGKVTDIDLDYKNYDPSLVTVPAGKKCVYIKILVTNVSQSSNYVSVGDFSCYVDNISVFQEFFNGKDGDSYNANIDPGRSAVLGALYVVPENASSIELEYDPIGEYADRVIIKLL